MSDCQAGCLVTIPTTDYDFGGCGLQDAIRSGFIKHFVGLRCDTTITDITDNVEIAGYYSAGTMFTSPTITGEIPEASTGGEITENCQPAQPTQRDYAFNWTSYRVDVTGLTDSDFYSKLDGALTSWSIAPVTCDNLIIVPQDFTTTGTFFDMRGIINTVYPNENAMYYSANWVFRYNDVLAHKILTSAVISAMGMTGTSVT